MSFEEVIQLLDRRIGLGAEAVSAKALNRAVRNRMADLKIPDRAAYLDRLREDKGELEWLIDRIVVLETWFFRDVEPFIYLKKYIRDYCRPLEDRSFRILSIPCSTGEEPYSIAMTLLDMEPPPHFQVDAVDISSSALERARKAHYGRNSFRETDRGLLGRFFQPEEGYRRVAPEVCEMVRFYQGNILDYASLAHNVPYHAVFCRNLLIYLSQSARDRAVDNIDRLLARDGVLFLGYAESFQQFFPGYFRVGRRRAYAALKPGPKSSDAVGRPARRSRPSSRKKAGIQVKPAAGLKPEARPYRARKGEVETGSEESDLDRARSMADEGRLDSAKGICRAVLDGDPCMTDAHFLMGVIALAQSRESEAEKYFSRALYLDPEHEQSLSYMALLMDKLSRPEKADLFRGRLARLRDRRPAGDERNFGVS